MLINKKAPFLALNNPTRMSQSALSICVRLSRKAYYPGGVVGGIITLEPIRASDEGEYLSFISVQVCVLLLL